MADDTKLTISVETILRGLDKTLKGLSQVEKQLKSVASVKLGGTTTGGGIDKATLAAQKLATQVQELNNRQLKAALTADRLALSQLKLEQSFARVAAQSATASKNIGAQADAHVRAFKAIERSAVDANRQVQQFRDIEANLKRAPQMDAHVQAFRALGGEITKVNTLFGLTAEQMSKLGNGLRSLGQGAASTGAVLSVTLTAPLVALGASVVDAATSLDSLTRGLTAITGSSAEAGRQLARLTQLAKLPGIGFQEAIQGSIRLQAVGFSAAEAEKSLKEFANAIALTGGGRDELARVTVQLGQLAAKGKVLSQDLRPIIEAAPAVGRALKQAFGTVNADDIADMTTNSREFLDVLTKELEKLPRAAAGAKNSFENFRDSLFQAAAVVGETLLPSLIKLVEVVGPIITTLANGFASLPGPIQTIIVGLTALFAAAGPALFIFGQFSTGIGRAIVAFVQLNAAGLLPTITSLKALAAGSLAAAEAETVLATTTAIVTASIGGLVVLLAAVAAAYTTYNAAIDDSLSVTDDQVKATQDQVETLNQQLDFLNGLKTGVKRTADEQEKLTEIYKQLNNEAQVRVGGILNETTNTEALRAEITRLLQLRVLERELQAGSIATTLAATTASIDANEKEIASTSRRIEANSKLIDSIRAAGKIGFEQSRALAEQGVNASSAEEAIAGLSATNEGLLETQKGLRTETDKLTESGKSQAKTLALMEENGVGTARQFLETAKSAGVFKGSIEDALASMERFIELQKQLAPVVSQATSELLDQAGAFINLGKAAEKNKQTEEDVVKGMLAHFAGIARNRAEFDKLVQDALQKFPALRKAIEDLRKQGTFSDAFSGLIGKPTQDKSGTSLRNAQEKLQQALADAAQAGAEQRSQIEQNENERLLQVNENNFRLQLIAYRQYLNQRAFLLTQNLQLEINAQKQIVDAALAEQKRFEERAGKAGLPAAERTRARAGAAEAERTAIAAQTKVLDLQAKQKAVTDAVTEALAEQAKQQSEDITQLEIEYGQLRGSIEAALKAETVEKFRKELRDLGLAQDDINKRVQELGPLLSAEQKQELELARQQNQRKIDAINNIIAQRDALAELTAAEQLVTNAKERQKLLEDDLTFQVQFRGLTEEEAIRQRLAGEEKLQQSLLLSKSIIEASLKSFTDLGKTPPPQLKKFIDDITDQIKGLGELSFTEQFRLAEKEFTRIQDELANKIADVERAIRQRDIAEVQGRLIIRGLNNEYIGSLEAQLKILQDIAAQSNDETLKRQAASAQQSVKDTRAAADEVKNFGRQLKSVSVDALNSSLSQLFKDLRDNTQSAAEDIKNFFFNILDQVNDFLAQDLGRKITEALFPDPNKKGGAGGFLDQIKAIFTGGNKTGTTATGPTPGGDAAAVLLQSSASLATTLTTAGATTAAALTTGGTAAGAALTTGATTAGVALSASLTAAAATFSAAVIAAGAAFAAAVGAASATQAASGFASAAGSGIGNFAIGDLVPAVPQGKVIRVAEGGYDEAVLTTDPKYAVRQAAILREFLKRTRGLAGRFRAPEEFAAGGIISARDAEANLLQSVAASRSLSRTPSAPSGMVPAAGSGGPTNVRILNFADRKKFVGGHIRSAEGAIDIMNTISDNADEIGRRLGIK